ncbi:tryptophan synthase subunit alpha [bacterium]|nr:tryptophan synthase subunit alpha [bacterium]
MTTAVTGAKADGATTGGATATGAAGPTAGGRRIRDAIARAGKAFIPFVTCGDPDLETTERLVLAMADAGADVIELGVPFSDPTAEGPVIQEASLRAIAAGTTPAKVIQMVRRLRARTDVPLVFMTYANVVYSRGTAAFVREAAAAGVDGLILADVPYEEKAEFEGPCREAGVALISMVAPTSRERVARIASEADGFLYVISSLGVTGVRSEITTNVGEIVSHARSASDVPCAVGFGVSTPEQAERIARDADGVIVGSAIVRIVAEHGARCVEPVAAYVRSMKEAVRRAAGARA